MNRLPFLDWMKAVGMLLIVYGHSSAGTRYFTTDPIVVKQLGVAFFVFAASFTLVRETRPTRYVVFLRLFSICLYGLAFAMFMSLANLWIRHDLAESNYLPFLFGVNVLFNSFPANPTTWYIGTYIHIIVLWALLLRNVIVRWWMIAAWVPVSIVARALLIATYGQYVAYMLFTNWLSLLLLGLYCGSGFRHDWMWTGGTRRGLIIATGILVALLCVWPACVGQFSFDDGFPFRVVRLNDSSASVLATSALVELIYLLATISVFNFALYLPRLRIVEFFARNSLVIFIFHMPLVRLLSPYVGRLPNGHLRVTVNVLIYFVALAFVSECLMGIVKRLRLQELCLARLRRHVPIAG